MERLAVSRMSAYSDNSRVFYAAIMMKLSEDCYCSLEARSLYGFAIAYASHIISTVLDF